MNGSNWILDPANPLQMWSGLGGPNNELRMPDYVFPQETVRNPATPQGSLTGNINVNSTSMGYSINYRVYTPAGYAANQLRDLPVVYVTDGHEYLADHLGSMVVVLDNLIAAGELRPTIAVFIDPRQPGNPGNNRRISEYGMNPNFANFVAGELVPAIDAAYRTDDTADGRTILGTSMGGLNAAYFGAVKSNVFHNIAPQSPAYNQNSAIYSLYQNNDLQFLDIFQTNGTLGGDRLGANQMANVWTANGYDFARIVANEGHSWGQWRGQLDDILTAPHRPAAHRRLQPGRHRRRRRLRRLAQKLRRRKPSQPRPPQLRSHRPARLQRLAHPLRPNLTTFGCHCRLVQPCECRVPEPAAAQLFMAGCGTAALTRLCILRPKVRRLSRRVCR